MRKELHIGDGRIINTEQARRGRKTAKWYRDRGWVPMKLQPTRTYYGWAARIDTTERPAEIGLPVADIFVGPEVDWLLSNCSDDFRIELSLTFHSLSCSLTDTYTPGSNWRIKVNDDGTRAPITVWFKSVEDAALFKLTFSGVEG